MQVHAKHVLLLHSVHPAIPPTIYIMVLVQSYARMVLTGTVYSKFALDALLHVLSVLRQTIA